MALRLSRGLGERRAVVGEQRLVGRHQVLAVGESRLRERPRSALRPPRSARGRHRRRDGPRAHGRRPASRARRARRRDPCPCRAQTPRPTSIERPVRCSSSAALSRSSASTPQPTVPSPAIAIRNGSGMSVRFFRPRSWRKRRAAGRSRAGRRIARAIGHDGMERPGGQDDRRAARHTGEGRRAFGGDVGNGRRDHPPFAAAGSSVSSAG